VNVCLDLKREQRAAARPRSGPLSKNGVFGSNSSSTFWLVDDSLGARLVLKARCEHPGVQHQVVQRKAWETGSVTRCRRKLLLGLAGCAAREAGSRVPIGAVWGSSSGLASFMAAPPAVKRGAGSATWTSDLTCLLLERGAFLLQNTAASF